MTFNAQLVDRIREVLAAQSIVNKPHIEEKAMFGGLCFMMNNKMLICIGGDGLLCRIGKTQATKELENSNCRQSIMGTRTMKDYVDVAGADISTREALNYWVTLCLQFNKEAKASKPKSLK